MGATRATCASSAKSWRDRVMGPGTGTANWRFASTAFRGNQGHAKHSAKQRILAPRSTAILARSSAREKFSSRSGPQAVWIPATVSMRPPASGGGLLPAALLVLLAAAAGTGIVSPDLGPGGGPGRGRGGPEVPAGSGLATAPAVPRGGQRQIREIARVRDRLGLHGHLDLHQALDRLLGDARLHGLEQLEALALVLDERILLAVAPEADPLLQVVHAQQVVLPLRVHHLQQHHPLQVPHHVGADL